MLHIWCFHVFIAAKSLKLGHQNETLSAVFVTMRGHDTVDVSCCPSSLRMLLGLPTFQ